MPYYDDDEIRPLRRGASPVAKLAIGVAVLAGVTVAGYIGYKQFVEPWIASLGKKGENGEKEEECPTPIPACDAAKGILPPCCTASIYTSSTVTVSFTSDVRAIWYVNGTQIGATDPTGATTENSRGAMIATKVAKNSDYTVKVEARDRVNTNTTKAYHATADTNIRILLQDMSTGGINAVGAEKCEGLSTAMDPVSGGNPYWDCVAMYSPTY